MAETVTITTRSRNIGIGWTNSVKQVYSPNGSYLRAADVDEPSVVGTRKAVLEEYERARRDNAGNDWAYEIFVGGRRVKKMQTDGAFGLHCISMLSILRGMCVGDVVELELDDAD